MEGLHTDNHEDCEVETGGATFGVCNIKTTINLLVIIFGIALPLVVAVGESIGGVLCYRRRKAIKLSASFTSSKWNSVLSKLRFNYKLFFMINMKWKQKQR